MCTPRIIDKTVMDPIVILLTKSWLKVKPSDLTGMVSDSV